MSDTIFVYAKPSGIKVTETYQYFAVVADNSTMEPVDLPEGLIQVEVPLDGEKYFSRLAYAQLERQDHQSISPLFSRIGYLAASNISAEEFWAETRPEERGVRQVLNLDLPITLPRSQLLEDRYCIKLEHQYRPKRPQVDPRQNPVLLQVNIYDERTISEEYKKDPNSAEWLQLMREPFFERSMIFAFHIELVLPDELVIRHPPVLKFFKIDWPATTPYHSLKLLIEPERPHLEYKNWLDKKLFYRTFQGCIEWGDVSFRSNASTGTTRKVANNGLPGLRLFRSPLMLLLAPNSGELFQESWLGFNFEVSLPGALLSRAIVQFFNATGQRERYSPITRNTILKVKGKIHPLQRFNRKVNSSHHHLQFEGLILDEMRMRDVANLLEDLGFFVDPLMRLDGDQQFITFTLAAHRAEGADEMRVWILARSVPSQTERETVIPDGMKFTTSVGSGNTEFDLRAELPGNKKGLSDIMNDIDQKLKERFSHLVNPE